jgi:hypothetical protein
LVAAEASLESQHGGGDGGEVEEGAAVKVLGKLAPRSEQAEAARKALEAQERDRKTKAAAKLQELEKKIASKKKEEQQRPSSALLDGALPVRYRHPAVVSVLLDRSVGGSNHAERRLWIA